MEFAKAFSKFQGEITGALKDSTNPFFKTNYADLASCWDAIRKPLADNGLSVIQLPTSGEVGMVTLTTILLHSGGYSIDSTMSMKPTKSDPQSIGGCLTYLRRYMLSAVTGLAQVDDDANGASQKVPVKKSKPINSQSQCDEGQKQLMASLMKAKRVKWDEFQGQFNVNRLSDLTAAQAQRSISWLQGHEINPELPKSVSTESPIKKDGE